MGMDISFKASAIEQIPELITYFETNGDAKEIAEARSFVGPDYPEEMGYRHWLCAQAEVLWLMDVDIKVVLWRAEDWVQVTANKWGRVYAPLTQLLEQHDIEWEEH